MQNFCTLVFPEFMTAKCWTYLLGHQQYNFYCLFLKKVVDVLVFSATKCAKTLKEKQNIQKPSICTNFKNTPGRRFLD